MWWQMQSKCEGRVLLRAAAGSGEGVKPWGVSPGDIHDPSGRPPGQLAPGNLLWGDGPHHLCISDEIRGRSFPLFGLQTLIPVLSTHHAFQEKVNADINRRISAAGAPAKSLLIFRAHRQLKRRAAHPSPEQSEVNLHLFCVAPPSPLLPHHTRATLRVSGLLPGQAIL